MQRRHRTGSFFPWMLLLPFATLLNNSAYGQYTCTQVIGYSQAGQENGGWYVTGGAFEAAAGDAAWQLLWNGGAGVDMWQIPDYEGWNNTIQSPCAAYSTAPDRILLAISGPYGSDVQAWASAIDSTVKVIKTKYPSVSHVVLQPVVGGPGHATCMAGTDSVRASWQHKYIDQAIELVVAGRTDVSAGYSPEVGSCDDYRDALGHLNADAATAIGQEIGQYYAAASSIDPAKTAKKERRQLDYLSAPGRLILFPDGFHAGDYSLTIFTMQGKMVLRKYGDANGPVSIALKGNKGDIPEGVYTASLCCGKTRTAIVFPIF
jgi:hypothetical protein